MKRITCIVLVFLVAAFAIGCQTTDTSSTTSTAGTSSTTGSTSSGTTTTTSASTETVVLTAAIADMTNVEDFNKNDVTLWMESTLNVDLQFTVYESSDFNNKINLKIMGGDPLEDIVFGGFPDSMVFAWANEGVLAPLTEYYQSADVAPGIFDAIDRTGFDFRAAITMPDGEIYYVPTYNQSYGNEYFSKAWYYDSWLQKLGKEVPETTDEFYDVLKAASETDLNGNGVADEVGYAGYGGIYAGWFTWLMNAFVYTDTSNNFIKIDDGKASFAFLDDAWRDGIEYIKMLVDEGCIPTETVTQDNATWKVMINAADHTTFSIAYATPSPITNVDIKGDFLALAPLKGPNGVQFAQNNPSRPSCGMIVSVDCENPQKAFQVGDLCVTEENGIVTRFGARGLDWDYVTDMKNPEKYISPYEGFDPFIVVHDDANFWGSGKMQNRSWMQRGPYIRQYGIANGMAVDPETVSQFSKHEAAGIVLYQVGGYAPDEVIVKLLYTSDEDKVIQNVQPNLQAFIQETMANWILGNTVLDDAEWEKFKATIDTLNANDLLEVVQAAYTRSIS